MSKVRRKIHLTPVFWVVGLVLLCVISALIAHWPRPSGRIDKVLDEIYLVFIGIFLPFLWVHGKHAKRYEKILMFFVLVIPISTLLYWFHYRIVTIRVVGNSYGSMDAEINEFNNSHSRIKAELVYDWSQLDTNERFQKFQKYLKGNDQIDLIEIDDIWMSSAIDVPEGGLLPLDMFYERDMWERNFLLTSVEMARHSDTGRLYGIPLYINAGLMFYRKDLLGELTRPVTFTQLERSIYKTTSRVKKKGLEGFIFQSAQYEGLNCTFFELLSSVGGSIVDESGKVRLNSAKVKYVLKKMHGMIYKSGIIPSSVLVFKEEESRKLFYSGHAMVLRNWPYVLLKWKNSFPISRNNVGITYCPAPVLGAWYLGILKKTGHPEETWEVIKFLTRSSTLYARATHPDQSRRRLPPDMNLYSELKTQYDFLPGVEKALYMAKPRPHIKNYQSLSNLLSKAIYSILSDENMTEKTINSVLDSVQKEYDR
jgi:multiple sugar transport system substrate-binding protein